VAEAKGDMGIAVASVDNAKFLAGSDLFYTEGVVVVALFQAARPGV
jgi:hypothetical protein